MNPEGIPPLSSKAPKRHYGALYYQYIFDTFFTFNKRPVFVRQGRYIVADFFILPRAPVLAACAPVPGLQTASPGKYTPCALKCLKTACRRSFAFHPLFYFPLLVLVVCPFVPRLNGAAPGFLTRYDVTGGTFPGWIMRPVRPAAFTAYEVFSLSRFKPPGLPGLRVQNPRPAA